MLFLKTALLLSTKFLNLVNNWLAIIQNWIYPPTCLLCGDDGSQQRDLCSACADSLPYQQHACRRCGISMNDQLPEGLVCGQCQNTPPHYDSATALFHYQDSARHLICALKYNNNYACARLLGELMAARLITLQEMPQVLIPVPLHAQRYRQRGFNQAIEICRPLTHALNIPMDTSSCLKQRATTPQSELSSKQRRENLKQAFAARKRLNYKHVAIVDDVVTTGTTVNELSKTLKQAGVSKIAVWTCARA